LFEENHLIVVPGVGLVHLIEIAIDAFVAVSRVLNAKPT